MEKILVIQTAFIGDAILTLPMLQKLKEIFPSSTIDVVAIPAASEIFLASPYVDDVLVLEKRGRHKSFLSFLKFAGDIKKNSYSRIYSPHRSLRSSLLVLLSGVKNTVGFDINSLKYVYKNLVRYEYSLHEVHRNLKLIGYDISDDKWEIKPEVIIPENFKQSIREFLWESIPSGNKIESDKIVAVAPGSVWNTKKYPAEYFEQIIKYFVSKNFSVVLIGGVKDTVLCEELANSSGNNVVSAAGKFSILESIEFLKHCRLLVSNDSAPTHFGMCSDIPVLTLFCSTVAEFGFYPYNRKSSFLSYDQLFCKPCGIHGYNECPIKTFDCGYNLKPQTVIEKIEDILNGS